MNLTKDDIEVATKAARQLANSCFMEDIVSATMLKLVKEKEPEDAEHRKRLIWQVARQQASARWKDWTKHHTLESKLVEGWACRAIPPEFIDLERWLEKRTRTVNERRAIDILPDVLNECSRAEIGKNHDLSIDQVERIKRDLKRMIKEYLSE